MRDSVEAQRAAARHQSAKEHRCPSGGALASAAVLCVLLNGCARAPSFEIVGSFFPAWLVCLIVAILLTVFTRWLLLRFHIPIAWPILTHPSLTAFFTFALWLIFFRS